MAVYFCKVLKGVTGCEWSQTDKHAYEQATLTSNCNCVVVHIAPNIMEHTPVIFTFEAFEKNSILNGVSRETQHEHSS